MSGARRLSAVDSMWLEMDRPENLMVIDSLMWFDEPVDWDRLLDVTWRRLVERYPVFTQRPTHPLGGILGAFWEDDPDFDLARHVNRVTLAPPGDDTALQRYVEAQVSRPLDRSRPLWELHLVDGYRGGSAVYTRFHHSLADGIALAQVLLSMTDATADGDLRAEPEPGVRHHTAQPRASWTSPAGALRLAGQTLLVADKLLLGHNPQTQLSGPPGIAKRTVWTDPIPIGEVRRVGATAGATVNDVLVAALSGAVGTYLVEHGGVATDLTTMVPVDLRPPGAELPRELGNKFALVLLPLPTGSVSPLTRLAESKRRIDLIKDSPEAAITFGLSGAIGRTHPRLSRLLVDFFAGKAIGVTTNVPGPREPRYVAGTRVAGILGWVPGSGRQTLGACIFSYARMVRVGFKVDALTVPDPERLVAAFDEEMDDFLRLARAV